MKNEPLKIHFVNEQKVGQGNSFGYYSHQSQLKKSLEENGVIISDDAEIALHICPLIHYKPIENKINIVYSMYEFSSVPTHWVSMLSQLDLLVVPCNHNKELFERYTNSTPVEVCPEGCNTDKYTYVQREFPKSKPFRYYWFGINNPRKGYLQVLTAWDKFMQLRPDLQDKVELYLKACNGKEESIFHESNVYFDNRTLSIDELVELNNQAHCYLFPTMGEGWALTLCEAASTGLPCIYTDYSGPRDFLDDTTGYPLEFEMCDLVAEEKEIDWTFKLPHFTQGAYATMNSMIKNMYDVYINYNEALIKGKKAAEHIKNNFTWDLSAKKLINIIDNFMGLENRCGH